MRVSLTNGLFAGALVLCAAASSAAGSQPGDRGPSVPGSEIAHPADVATGILYDRVLPFSRIGEHDGLPTSPPTTRSQWEQMYFEIRKACLSAPPWPELPALREQVRRSRAPGAIPLALMNIHYDRTCPAATHQPADERPLCEARLFAATAFEDHTYRGRELAFTLERQHYLTNDPNELVAIEVDFADGRGYRSLLWGEPCPVSYAGPGAKVLRMRCTDVAGTVLQADFAFRVASLVSPDPQDTLSVTASIPYAGGYGSGEAYVYLAESHAVLTKPVVVVEGFDLDNSMNWDELYALLNQENLLETLRADDYDAVVLNFTDATDYIQRSAFAIVALLQQVQALIAPAATYPVVGPSLGGVAMRYALSYMESEGLPHRVRDLISFDAPHAGANIPLGLQYWLSFFAEDSSDAALLLAILNTAAARQLLVYHYTDPPTTIPGSDPLRSTLLAELAAMGNYPSGLRKVAVANGSGYATGQGYAPGDQIIRYEYRSLLVDIDGNVWAVPDGNSQLIFDGLVDLIWPLPDRDLAVTVSGTRPYDNAPGGLRASMAQMAATSVPYGQIEALEDNHCFIPTISALAVQTEDLFYDVAGDPDILAHTPFDAVYYPVENQEHVLITAESAAWFLQEIEEDLSAVAPLAVAPPSPVLYANHPNPFNPATRIAFYLPQAENVRLDVYSLMGQHIATLLQGELPAGRHEVSWQGQDARGRAVASGSYSCVLLAGNLQQARSMLLIK